MRRREPHTIDLKSAPRQRVRVRVPPSAPALRARAVGAVRRSQLFSAHSERQAPYGGFCKFDGGMWLGTRPRLSCPLIYCLSLFSYCTRPLRVRSRDGGTNATYVLHRAADVRLSGP